MSSYNIYRSRSLTLVCLINAFIYCTCHPSPRCLLISFDGFRWDYLNNASTPNFDKLIKDGVTATHGVVNAFITKTLPNHYTIVTGLYEESHGIVGNTMYDPLFNEVFHISDKQQATESKWFDNGGEPIWVTNQRQGNAHRSGVLYWPGDGAAVKGFRPYRYEVYNPDVKNETRVDKIIEWFTDDYPINLGLLYFEQPDALGHEVGPDSPEMKIMIEALDGVVGYLLQKIEEHNLGDLNVIITSDHGMASTPESKIIDLDMYINPTSYQIFSSDPIGSVLPNEGMEEEIVKNLSSVPHLKVYRKGVDIPDRFHYEHNRRIQPLLLVTDEGYSLRHNNSYVPKGNHGYDNMFPDMHPLFVAMGPAFKTGSRIETLHNVDIYPLVCHIMGLRPAPNNGSLDHVRPILKGEDTDNVFLVYIVILIFIALIGGIFSIAACRQQIFHRRHRKIQLGSLTTLTNSFHSLSTTANGGHVPLLVNSDTEDEF
ncbi:ectonucleotide pyrophosphatase/phosphodiesterase family member 5-like [Pecten maximus]|uniref:ectonucleotide pyrophosphatase/phosphodiesterase family member 5-like n=1 Tax=Pecten maximus TaxID=6579 RepID=UPI001458F5E2|nr:ectonucleotide pyrophosphatase/phosphodiesterase family member 5-like [Pecten maximus]